MSETDPTPPAAFEPAPRCHASPSGEHSGEDYCEWCSEMMPALEAAMFVQPPAPAPPAPVAPAPELDNAISRETLLSALDAMAEGPVAGLNFENIAALAAKYVREYASLARRLQEAEQRAERFQSTAKENALSHERERAALEARLAEAERELEWFRSKPSIMGLYEMAHRKDDQP